MSPESFEQPRKEEPITLVEKDGFVVSCTALNPTAQIEFSIQDLNEQLFEYPIPLEDGVIKELLSEEENIISFDQTFCISVVEDEIGIKNYWLNYSFNTGIFLLIPESDDNQGLSGNNSENSFFEDSELFEYIELLVEELSLPINGVLVQTNRNTKTFYQRLLGFEETNPLKSIGSDDYIYPNKTDILNIAYLKIQLDVDELSIKRSPFVWYRIKNNSSINN